jgi:hypothetical protein
MTRAELSAAWERWCQRTKWMITRASLRLEGRLPAAMPLRAMRDADGL